MLDTMEAQKCPAPESNHTLSEAIPRISPTFIVSDRLLDLMAADDETRHLAAVKMLEEKRKVTRAESYLRKKLRYTR